MYRSPITNVDEPPIVRPRRVKYLLIPYRMYKEKKMKHDRTWFTCELTYMSASGPTKKLRNM